MFNPDSRGHLNTTGSVEGGHCVLVNGYSITKQAFRILNSWAPRCGMGGQASIRHDVMGKLLNSDGEACIPVRRTP